MCTKKPVPCIPDTNSVEHSASTDRAACGESTSVSLRKVKCEVENKIVILPATARARQGVVLRHRGNRPYKGRPSDSPFLLLLLQGSC